MTSPICAALDSVSSPSGIDASPPSYEASSSARQVHRWTPRFGYTTDVTIFFTGADEQRAIDTPEEEEYVRGVLTPLIALGIFFFAWSLMILVFKCLGPNRVGWLSGRIAKSSSQRRLTRIRAVAALAGIGVLACCVLTITAGVASLSDAQDSMVHGLEQGKALADRSIRFVDSFWASQNAIIRIVDDFFLNSINTFCPNVSNQICELEVPEDVNDYIPDSVTAPPTIPDIPTDATVPPSLPEGATVPPGYVPEGTLPNQPDLPDDIPDEIEIPDGPIEPLEIRDRICDFEGVPYAELLEPLETVDFDVSYNELLRDGRADLAELSGDLHEYADTTETFEYPFQGAIGFVALLAFLDLILMISLFFAWQKDKKEQETRQSDHIDDTSSLESYLANHPAPPGERLPPSHQRRNVFQCCDIRCIKAWLLFPLFTLVTVAAAFFSFVTAVGSISTSDVCYQNPDAILLHVLEDQKHQFQESVAYDFMVYYVGGCLAEQRPTEIDEKIEVLLEKFQEVRDYLLAISGNVDLVEQICGADASPVTQTSQGLLDEMCQLTDLLGDVRDLFQCENWHKLYRTIVYDAVCDEANTGMHYIALCMATIVFLVLIMLTLRVAFYESSCTVSAQPTSKDLNTSKNGPKQPSSAFDATEQEVVSPREETGSISPISSSDDNSVPSVEMNEDGYGFAKWADFGESPARPPEY